MKWQQAGGMAIALFTCLRSASAQAPTVMTIDDFTRRALEEGVRGKQTAWALEQAGYTRRAVLNQTSLPSMTLSHDHNRSETDVSQFKSISDSKQTRLTINETTPLGTTLAAQGEYGDSTSPGSVGRPSLQLSGQQPLYLFVRNPVARQRRIAELNFSDAKSTALSNELSIRTQARTLYYSVMQGEASLGVENRQVTSLKKLVDITRALVDAGRSAPVEIMRARIRLQVGQSQLDNATANRDQSILQAKNFIFIPLEEKVRFVTDLEFSPFVIPLERLVEYGLLHQPNLEILRRARERAKLNYEATADPARPAFSVSGTYNTLEYKSRPFQKSWTYNASADWMFFDSFVTSNKVKSAQIDRWVADLNIENGERTARVNIQDAYIDVMNAQKQIEYFKNFLDQAQRNVEVVRLRFQNGLDRLTDVFDAENELRDLDNQYLGLLVQFNRSKDTLSELVGADVRTIQ